MKGLLQKVHVDEHERINHRGNAKFNILEIKGGLISPLRYLMKYS